jgi:hypothetical protein
MLQTKGVSQGNLIDPATMKLLVNTTGFQRALSTYINLAGYASVGKSSVGRDQVLLQEMLHSLLGMALKLSAICMSYSSVYI